MNGWRDTRGLAEVAAGSKLHRLARCPNFHSLCEAKFHPSSVSEILLRSFCEVPVYFALNSRFDESMMTMTVQIKRTMAIEPEQNTVRSKSLLKISSRFLSLFPETRLTLAVALRASPAV